MNTQNVDVVMMSYGTWAYYITAVVLNSLAYSLSGQALTALMQRYYGSGCCCWCWDQRLAAASPSLGAVMLVGRSPGNNFVIDTIQSNSRLTGWVVGRERLTVSNTLRVRIPLRD